MCTYLKRLVLARDRLPVLDALVQVALHGVGVGPMDSGGPAVSPASLSVTRGLRDRGGSKIEEHESRLKREK